MKKIYSQMVSNSICKLGQEMKNLNKIRCGFSWFGVLGFFNKEKIQKVHDHRD